MFFFFSSFHSQPYRQILAAKLGRHLALRSAVARQIGSHQAVPLVTKSLQRAQAVPGANRKSRTVQQ